MCFLSNKVFNSYFSGLQLHYPWEKLTPAHDSSPFCPVITLCAPLLSHILTPPEMREPEDWKHFFPALRHIEIMLILHNSLMFSPAQNKGAPDSKDKNSLIFFHNL